MSLQIEDVCATEAQTITKHIVSTHKKMKADKSFDLFRQDVKQKITMLDVDAPTLSRKERAPT